MSEDCQRANFTVHAVLRCTDSFMFYRMSAGIENYK